MASVDVLLPVGLMDGKGGVISGNAANEQSNVSAARTRPVITVSETGRRRSGTHYVSRACDGLSEDSSPQGLHVRDSSAASTKTTCRPPHLPMRFIHVAHHSGSDVSSKRGPTTSHHRELQ